MVRGPRARFLPSAVAASLALAGAASCDPPVMCGGVSCSGHGTCEISGSAAVCVCDEGYNPIGLTCVESPCARMECPPSSECVQEGGETFCECDEGFLMHDGRCVPDVNVTPGDCPAGGSSTLLHGDPDEFLHPGREAISDGEWIATILPEGSPEPHTVDLMLRPADPAQGESWVFLFSSEAIGEPLAVQLYNDAQRADVAEAGRPGLSISADGIACETIDGRFQVVDIAADEPGLSSFLAVFEQRCVGHDSTLRGCIRYASP